MGGTMGLKGFFLFLLSCFPLRWGFVKSWESKNKLTIFFSVSAPRLVDNVSGTASVGWTQTSRIQVRYKFTWFQCATEDWDSPRHWTNDRIPIKITNNCSQATELWVLGSSENCHREPTWSASTDLSSSCGRGNTPREWVENTPRIMMFAHNILMLI